MDELIKKALPSFFFMMIISTLAFAYMAVSMLSVHQFDCSDDEILHNNFVGEYLTDKEKDCIQFNKDVQDNSWIGWAIAGSVYGLPFVIFIRVYLIRKQVKGDWRH